VDELSSPVTPNQLSFYRANGYLVVADVISPEDCDRAHAAYERYAKPDFRGVMNMDRGYVEYVLDEHTEFEDARGCEVRYKTTERITVDPGDAKLVRQMMKHRTVVDVLKTLQGAPVWGLQTMFLFKRGGTDYGPQAWNPHQDGAYVGENSRHYITGNIPFEDQDPGNGCMFIFPGSHREPILPSEKVQSFHEKAGQRPGHKVEVPGEYPRVNLLLKKGSVLFLHGHVIHGSYPNNSRRPRPMLLIPYITKGYSFISGETARREPIELE